MASEREPWQSQDLKPGETPDVIPAGRWDNIDERDAMARVGLSALRAEFAAGKVARPPLLTARDTNDLIDVARKMVFTALDNAFEHRDTNGFDEAARSEVIARFLPGYDCTTVNIRADYVAHFTEEWQALRKVCKEDARTARIELWDNHQEVLNLAREMGVLASVSRDKTGPFVLVEYYTPSDKDRLDRVRVRCQTKLDLLAALGYPT
jgi:hypothetical protein